MVGLCACGSSGGGNSAAGSVNGAVAGVSYAIADAVSGVVQSGDNETEAMILLSTKGDLCSRIAANQVDRNEGLIGIFLEDFIGSGSAETTAAPTAPGTYSIPMGGAPEPPPMAAAVDVHEVDKNCEEILSTDVEGSAGTITLTSVSGGAFSGTFDLTMATGDHITGSFDPEACAPIAGSSAPEPTCN